MQFSLNLLSWWQWALIGAVPPAILALYFLKLKRVPLEVPSTYLWRKSIEDLRVNSLRQRLRQSLLLFLQLLLAALAIFSLLKPSLRGTQLAADRMIFLVDNSASMSTVEGGKSRLDQAKEKLRAIVDNMSSSQVAMVVSFCDEAKVEQMFTGNRKDLRRAIDAIEPTERGTNMLEALQLAAGLANPGASSFGADNDPRVAGAKPATLMIYSDGKVGKTEGFSLGNLEPEFIPIGEDVPGNVAITAFGVGQNPEKPEERQAFGRVENYFAEPQDVSLGLYLNGELLDAQQVKIEAEKSSGVAFSLASSLQGKLELRIDGEDSLALDNVAYAALNKPQKTCVLLVSPGNLALSLVLSPEFLGDWIEVKTQTPSYLDTPEFLTATQSGEFDLIVFDRVAPKKPPEANAFYVDSLPPGDRWKVLEKVDAPQIIDTERSHPLMNILELSNLLIAEATPLVPPNGGTVLVDSPKGPLLAIAPRGAFEDLVLAFSIESAGDDVPTNWPTQLSFPAFTLNMLKYFGKSQGLGGAESAIIRPGQVVSLTATSAAAEVQVTRPNGEKQPTTKGEGARRYYSSTSNLGVYETHEGDQPLLNFAVNLFDSSESDNRVARDLKIGFEKAEGKQAIETSPHRVWKWVLAAALAVLLFEWYIYNRRVYI